MADPKNYTGIFPPTYGGSFITQDLISPLLQPFLRREEIQPEEIQPVEGSEAIRINLRTGMPEAIRDIEIVPGEYGPIESGGGIQGLLEAGVLNFLKAKNFLSTPEGREQVATVAQEMPSQLAQAGKDYVVQQVDMANRGLQEVYDPETNTIVDFTFPQTVAETMLGTAAAQPAIQLQRGEFIAPMVQKVKGGTQLNLPGYRKAYLDDYQEAMENVGELQNQNNFSKTDREGILNKIEKYFTNDAGTPNDPIRAMVLRGDLTPEPGRTDTSFENLDPYAYHQYYKRGTTSLPPSLPEEIRREAGRADQIIVLQNQLRKLEETRAPMQMGANQEFSGYRSAEDLAQARSLQNQITQLAEQDTGLAQQTIARQLFDKEYDDALPISGTLLTDEPGADLNVYERNPVKKEKVLEIKENIGEELKERQNQYEQLSRKLDPNQPFQGFANQAELERYRDLAYGPRFPQEIAPFVGIDKDIYASTPDYFIDRAENMDDKRALRQLFEYDEPIRRAMYEDEILYSPNVRGTGRSGLGFMEPETFMENVALLDPKKIKNMSFPQMVKAGRDAQLKNWAELTKSDKPAELAAAILKRPNLKSRIKPEVLLQSKGLETMMTGENGIIFRLLRPEDTALEGVVMEHSVGRYNQPIVHPTYNQNPYLKIKGGQEGFLEGAKRVYSLRDPATGRSRFTIDLGFDTNTNRPLEVHQVKGFDNDDKISLEDQDLLFSFLKNLGVDSETVITEPNAIGQALSSLFARPYAEGGIVSLANGGAVEHGIVTL